MSVATQAVRHKAVQAGPGGAGLLSLRAPGTFFLPLGFVDDQGRCHREVELRPLTGHEQRLLTCAPPSLPVALIITELLGRTLKRLGSMPAVDRGLVRGLLPGDREFLLLKLYQMTFGNNLLAVLNCPVESCGEWLELPIAIEQCVPEAPPVGSRTWLLKTAEEGGRSLRFRLPTGADQEALSSLREIAPEALRQRLLLACCAEPDGMAVAGLSPEECACIEEQMNRLAPQIEVEVEAVCPECGAGFAARIDVPYLALSEMNVNEAELDWEIHYLAWHYHWPETEILALTPGRRRRYISLVQRELEGSGEN
jgi:hypothetical protein